MNICMLSPTSLSLASARHLFSAARHLAARGLEITLIVPNHYHLPFEEAVPEDETRDGVRIKHVFLPRRWRGSVRTHLFPLGYWTWAMTRRAREDPCDIVHVMKPAYTSASAGLFLSLISRRPLVIECDDLEGEAGWAAALSNESLIGFKTALTCAYERRLPLLADAVIASTRALEEMFLSRGVPRNRLFYIPYCVEEYMVRAGDGARIRRERGLGDAPVIIYCGALHPHHYDVDLLIPAMEIVRATLPRARMLIVGDGGARPDLQKTAGERGLLDGAIIFTGWVREEQIPDYLSAADVAVVPMRDTPAGRSRGLSKVLECLCQGKPVVMPRVGQADELTDGGKGGVLVKAGDPYALADGIIALLKDPARAREKGAYGRRYAVERFDRSGAADTRMAIYRSVMERRA